MRRIYKEVGTDFSEIEKRAFDKQQFEATLDLLERRLPGQRNSVREALALSLKPNLLLKNATRTHEALLCLARTRIHGQHLNELAVAVDLVLALLRFAQRALRSVGTVGGVGVGSTSMITPCSTSIR